MVNNKIIASELKQNTEKMEKIKKELDNLNTKMAGLIIDNNQLIKMLSENVGLNNDEDYTILP
jgi:hypothetical protein